MPHLVKYMTPDGQPGEHEVDELHDAIAHVERLRNEEGVEGARIFRIEEVRFEFKPYYRVEIGSAASPVGTPAPAAPAPTAAPAAAAPAPAPVLEAAPAPIWAPPAEPTTTAVAAASAPSAPDDMVPQSDSGPAGAPVVVDPWADAPPPPPGDADATPAANGRRGLFGR